MSTSSARTSGTTAPRRTMGVRARRQLLNALTWVVTCLFFFPVAWMVFTSLRTEQDASTIPPSFAGALSFDQYASVLQRGFAQPLLNSFAASILATLIMMLLAIPAAYGLSIRPIKNWRDALFFFISTRFMPVAAIIIPLYLVVKSIGGLDNIVVLGILYVGINLPIAIWMLRSFFSEVPVEIIEAARVDGAPLHKEIVRIALPIVAPGVAAAALICFIFSWNEYFLALVMTSSNAQTLPPFLGGFVSGRGQFLAVLSAASTLAIIPVVAAGWIAQKQLVRGLAMGAVK